MTEVSINNKKYKAEEGETILQVLMREGIDIPYLCYHAALAPYGSCRLCMVEIIAGGKKGLATSCTLTAVEGLKIKTDTPKVVQTRKILLELYLAEAPGSVKIQELAKKYGVESSRFANPDIKAKGDRCVLCGRCVRVCGEILGVGAINFIGRGVKTCVNTPWQEESPVSIGCGACAYVCPAEAVDITAKGNKRIMTSWNKTTLKVEKCSDTKIPFATERGLEFAYEKLTAVPEELRTLSPEARRVKTAADLFVKPKR